MSHLLSKGALGLIAASLALGGVQFGMASDGGFARAVRGDARFWQNDENVTSSVASVVNRTGKSDRASLPSSRTDTATLSFQIPGLKQTSVAMRWPTTDVIRMRSVGTTELAKDIGKDAAKTVSRRKAAVACEPVVSVLTDVAKQLEPGRCVT